MLPSWSKMLSSLSSNATMLEFKRYLDDFQELLNSDFMMNYSDPFCNAVKRYTKNIFEVNASKIFSQSRYRVIH